MTSENADTSLVAVSSDVMGPPHDFLLPFSKKAYSVPKRAIKVISKSPCELEDANELKKILNTKAPEAWWKLCYPDHMVQLRGEEGLVNYAHVKFKNGTSPEEYRWLILISKRICDVNFSKMKLQLEAAYAEDPSKAPSSNSAKARFGILDWRSSKDCPSSAQLNPEVNRFVKCLDPPTRSLALLEKPAPAVRTKVYKSSKRKAVEAGRGDTKEADALSLLPGIKRQRSIQVSSNYRIIEDAENGYVHILELGIPPARNENADSVQVADPPLLNDAPVEGADDDEDEEEEGA